MDECLPKQWSTNSGAPDLHHEGIVGRASTPDHFTGETQKWQKKTASVFELAAKNEAEQAVGEGF